MKRFVQLLMWLAVFPVFSQEPIIRFCNSITPQELQPIAEKLASPEFEGREFNTTGEKMAAEYISGQLSQIQLKKITPNYQMDLSIPYDSLVDFKISSSKSTLQFWQDFRTSFWNLFTEGQKIPVIYAGFGIDHPNYSDYSKINAKEKFVVIHEGQPIDSRGIYLTSNDTVPIDSLNSIIYKEKIASKHGAAGIFILKSNEKFEEGKKLVEPYYKKYFLAKPYNNSYLDQFLPSDRIAILNFIDDRFVELLTPKLDNFQDLIKLNIDQGTTPAGLFEDQLTCNMQVAHPVRKSQNILGLIEGKNKDSIILLGAHYDHAGKNDSTYYPGADDNASGVAALLKIAETFTKAQKEGFRPEKSILFAFWGGEEQALLGSHEYCKNPVFKPENTEIYINLDMIGRCDSINAENPNFVYALPINEKAKSFTREFNDIARLYAGGLKIITEYPFKHEKIELRSDYFHFSKASIPSIGFTTGLHPDYHTPKDIADKLNYINMANIARFVFAQVWELSGMQKR